MREIKFRGKTEEMNSWWTYGSLVICDNGDYQIGHCKGYGHTYFRNKVFQNTVGQYTGLHDKNGKEIYEGDIAKVEVYDYDEPVWSSDFAVDYSKDLGCFTFDDLADISNYKTMQEIRSYYHYDIEIIGNIYDNKELLREG